MYDNKDLMEEFVDSSHKIVTACPECGSQCYIYILEFLRVNQGEDFVTQYCESCKKPYVVYLKVDMVARVKYFECK